MSLNLIKDTYISAVCRKNSTSVVKQSSATMSNFAKVKKN